MTADDLMRLVNRYVEACDDLGDGLFEKPLTTTDALHAKATELHGQILAEAYRLQDVESAAMAQALKLETARSELARVNNEFGSETADWPDAWRRVAEVKERAGRLWRDNETLRAALTVVVRDWTEQFERNGHLAPAWVRQAREALGPNQELGQAFYAAGAASVSHEPLRRLWPLIERSMKDYVFTGDKAGEVAADMAALRKFLGA